MCGRRAAQVPKGLGRDPAPAAPALAGSSPVTAGRGPSSGHCGRRGPRLRSWARPTEPVGGLGDSGVRAVQEGYAVPPVATVPLAATLIDDLAANAAQWPDHVAVSRRTPSGWAPVTCAQLAAQVRALAGGLLGAGVAAGDRVALLAHTRYEWMLADYAIWTAGAVTVPIYETSSPEQIAWILRDSGAIAAIVETATHQAIVEGLRPEVPAVRQVWQIDAGNLDQLAASGAAASPAPLAQRRADMDHTTLATIVYTSGTTGRPKGCQLTHFNFVHSVANITAADGVAEIFSPAAATLLFLPLAHVLARLIQLCAVHRRVRLGHLPTVRALSAELKAFQPTLVLAVPRVFEKAYAGAHAQAHDQGRDRIFTWADRVAVRASRQQQRGRVQLATRVQQLAADRVVYRRLRAELGGVRWAVTGGGPLAEQLGHFFRGADGEVLLRGPHIFTGYWHNPAATAEALAADGWLRTGDLGELSAAGHLRITGRKKDVLVTAGGKNVSPGPLEDRLRTHPLISQALAVGDARPYIACLLTLDADTVAVWARQRGKSAGTEELRADAELRAEVQTAVDAANAEVSQAESIRRFRILPGDFSEVGGQLTPTQKVRRMAVTAAYAADIDALYR